MNCISNVMYGVCVCVCVLFIVGGESFRGGGEALVPERDIRRADQNCLFSS